MGDTAPTEPTAASAAHGGTPRLMVVSTSSPRSATRRTATTASRLRAARSATLLAVRRSSYSPVRTPVLARTHAAPLSCSTSTLVRLVLYACYTNTNTTTTTIRHQTSGIHVTNIRRSI